MTLNDEQIHRRAAAEGLIKGHSPDNIQNCGCLLTAGVAFEPSSGRELAFDTANAPQSMFWELGPSETLIVMTEEIVSIPSDLVASYTPLHRLGKRGVMLLNPAVVEPGYQGRLSCYLVNFSSESVPLARNEASRRSSSISWRPHPRSSYRCRLRIRSTGCIFRSQPGTSIALS